MTIRASTETPFYSHILGFCAAILVVFIWSGWIVLSRDGVQGVFSIWDLGLLRFGTAAVVVLPFMLFKIPLKTLFSARIAFPALSCGTIYVLLSFAALRHSPATNAGVVVNGLMPIVTIVLLFAMVSRKPTRLDIVSSVLLLGANLLLLNGNLIGLGAFALFLGATLSLTFYMVLVRQWKIDLKLFFFAVPIVNAAVMIPLWLVFDGSLTGPIGAIALQAGYQGILVTLGAVTMLTYAIHKIGSITVSMIMAAVPFTTATLAYFVLSEDITFLHVVALVLCTGGITLHVLKRVADQ
ncbi:MAG: DMT family transporter [Colwellia sp.]|nr:DMT family transporter [Colwellia sp.]